MRALELVDRAKLEAAIKDAEGLRLKPYVDCCGGPWHSCRCEKKGKLSIGWGRNLDDVGISVVEAEILFDADLVSAAAELEAGFAWALEEDEVRLRALVELVYNLGAAGLRKFVHTLRAWRRRDYLGAAAGLRASLWFRQTKRRGRRVVGMVETGKG